MNGKIIYCILLCTVMAGVLFSCIGIQSREKKSIDPDTMVLIKNMGIGWNAGNSLEAMGGETNWGNAPLNQALFNAVKKAGFNTVRLPVSWSKFSDRSKYIIKPGWMERVTEVVNIALDAGLYVIINEHWDGGWLEPTYKKEKIATKRLTAIWEQVAANFRDFDHRLMFAGTNEVMVKGDYGPPTEEYAGVQNGYNQTFVNTVRKTGGKNTDRYLIVQGFNTNIDYTVMHAVMPKDSVKDRLIMEVHYYDPYNFTLNENSTITQWGKSATDNKYVESWGNEHHADSQFKKMKTNFIEYGIPVILGEYGVISRFDVKDHEKYRVHYNQYITQAAVDNDMVPIYWDNGYAGDHGFALFDRNDGSQLYPDIINAIVSAAP